MIGSTNNGEPNAVRHSNIFFLKNHLKLKYSQAIKKKTKKKNKTTPKKKIMSQILTT